MPKQPSTETSATQTTRASRKKGPAHQTHGALERPPMNLMKAFGIRDAYTTDSVEEYKAEIDAMTTSDLHEHAHDMGIVPLDARDKLIQSLERKFVEAKLQSRPPRQLRVKTNPAMAGFMRKFAEGVV